ncbi:MAG: hypothetical protein KA214_10035 [Neisseriaceae bacterium]|nr:hypothetical protein [Neisseriaceae bacterium]
MNTHYHSFIFLSAMLLSACESVPNWRQDGFNQHQAQNQLADCEYKVGMKKQRLDPHQQKKLVDSCMQSKGFRYHGMTTQPKTY